LAAAAAALAPGCPGGVTGTAAQLLSLVSFGFPGPASSPPAPVSLVAAGFSGFLTWAVAEPDARRGRAGGRRAGDGSCRRGSGGGHPGCVPWAASRVSPTHRRCGGRRRTTSPPRRRTAVRRVRPRRVAFCVCDLTLAVSWG